MFAADKKLKTIYVSDKWQVPEDTDSMFNGCTALTGANGTTYNEDHVDGTYACIDKAGQPGYLTATSATRQGDTLYLHGNVGEFDLQPYLTQYDNNIGTAYDDTIKHIIALPGTVLPENCGCMFIDLRAVTDIDLKNADTSNVKNMSCMFYRCYALTSLDLSGFDTSNVLGFSDMFYECRNLTSLDLTGFDTSKTTDLSKMFYNCKELTSLDISDFDTAKVTDMSDMFNGCAKLETIKVSDEWSTANVDLSDDMFTGCTALVGGNGTTYDSTFTNKTYARIDGENPGYLTAASSAELIGDKLVLRGDVVLADVQTDANKAAVKSVYAVKGCTLPQNSTAMFRGFTKLEEVDLRNADTSNVISMSEMFSGCTSLKTLDLSYFDTSKNESISYMFYGCSELTELDISGFNTANTTMMNEAFRNCGKLKTIYVSTGWRFDSFEWGYDMFTGCSSLIGSNGTICDGTNNHATYARIDREDTPGYLTGVYTATVTATNGSATADKTEHILKGDEVALTITPDEHYHIESVKVNGTPIAAPYNSFAMPDDDAEIAVTCAIDTYLITFKNDDGSELKSGNVAYGTTPVYSGETPTKAADAQYTYTFSGWTPTISKVTGKKTYTATYSETVNKYTVTFVDEDGTVLETDTVEYGEKPVYTSEKPIKEKTAQYTYVFNGWSDGTKTYNPDYLPTVLGDVTYTASYKEEIRRYKVKWFDEDGTTRLEVDWNVYCGTMPTYDSETPTKAADDQYTYTFAGWTDGTNTYGLNDELPAVSGDVSYWAVFESTVNKYTVKFVDEDGNVLQSSDVDYGTKPVYSGKTPTKAATAQYTYTFKGWDKEIASVTGEATYTATYSNTLNKYAVKFVNEDGTVLQNTNVDYGTKPVYSGKTPTKAATAQYTYTFAGWDKEIAAVTGAATYTATYTSTVNKYTVKWVNEDGTLLETDTVEYGKLPEYNGDEPVKANTAENSYAFAGWDKTVAEVTGDVTYKATYGSTANPYTITYKVDGKAYKTATLRYGDSIVLIAAPTKAGYAFSGWQSAYKTMPAGNIEITGSFAIDKTTLKHVEAKEPTYTDEGNTEYWYSETLDKYFSDENGENEIGRDDTVVAKLVKNRVPGDANGDGKFDIKDATTIAQYLAGWNVKIDLEQADVDGDGNVTVRDMTLIKQSLAHWNVTLK